MWRSLPQDRTTIQPRLKPAEIHPFSYPYPITLVFPARPVPVPGQSARRRRPFHSQVHLACHAATEEDANFQREIKTECLIIATRFSKLPTEITRASHGRLTFAEARRIREVMRRLQILALFLVLAIVAADLEAQPATPERPQTPSAPQKPLPPTSPTSPGQGILLERQDARETRDRLNDIFNQYPPSVREVLRIDPTLIYRADYIANYPVLAAFLEQHPEVAHNPSYFIGERRFSEQETNPQLEAARALRNFVEFAGVVLIVMTITTGVIFLVRTVVEHRRWQRALRAQSELHNKLIDRFASSDELLGYLQSQQGRLFADAPLSQGMTRAADAPLARVFWSLQAGAVLACAGAGLLFASGRMQDDLSVVSSPISAFGVVVLAVGVGFLVSSIISFLLSQRLGLVQPLPARHGGEAPGS
jgi:hypothetical protein